MAELTVIIPTIGRPTLPRAIRSVWRQTVPTDLIVEFDPKETGCGPTLNRALTDVTTEWVATMGDDDALDPRYAELFQARPESADMVIFQMRFQDGKLLPLTTDPSELKFGYVGATYVVRTDLVKLVGGWIKTPCNPTLGEDWKLIEKVRSAGRKIHIEPQVTYYVKHDPYESESEG